MTEVVEKDCDLVLPALDGGGIRGLSELLILGELMERIKFQEGLDKVPKPCEYFDLIGGTGTGGIIAILLGRLRMSIEEAIPVYIDLGQKIFPSRRSGAYKAGVLKATMKEVIETYDASRREDARMKNDQVQGCRTFVCAMPAQTMAHPRPSPSYEVREDQGYDPKLWEVSHATTAAPRFFKNDNEEFVNGSLRYDNPTGKVLEEAERLVAFYGTNRSISCILSIGAPKEITLSERNRSQVLTKMERILWEIAADCEKVSDAFEEEYGGGGTRKSRDRETTHFRLNVKQGMQSVSLTEWMRMGDVKTHANAYMGGAVVDEKVNEVVNVLRTRRMQKEDEP